MMNAPFRPQRFRNIRHRPNTPRKSAACSDRIRQLALPNLHLVLAVIKDHFKTLKKHRVERLEKLAQQIEYDKQEQTKRKKQQGRESKEVVSTSSVPKKPDDTNYMYDNTVSDCLSGEESNYSQYQMKEDTNDSEEDEEDYIEDKTLTIEEIYTPKYNGSYEPLSELQNFSQSEAIEAKASIEDCNSLSNGFEKKPKEVIGDFFTPVLNGAIQKSALSDPGIPKEFQTGRKLQIFDTKLGSFEDSIFCFSGHQRRSLTERIPIKSTITADRIKSFAPVMHEPLGTFFTLARSGGKLALIKVCVLRSRNRLI